MKPGDAEWEESVEAMKGLGQAMKMNEEDVLGTLAMEPKRAAEAMATIFRWTLDNYERWEDNEEESSPEQLAERKKEWDAEMAVFWKRLDQLTGHIVGFENRPEFDPD